MLHPKGLAGNFGTSVGVDRRYSSPIRKKSGEINFGKLSKPSPPVIYANAAKQSSSSSSVVSAAAAAAAAGAAAAGCGADWCAGVSIIQPATTASDVCPATMTSSGDRPPSNTLTSASVRTTRRLLTYLLTQHA